MRCGLILLCAGSGERLKQKCDKAFIKIKGKPLFKYSYDVLKNFKEFKEIVVVSRLEYFAFIKNTIKDSRLILCEGGVRRQDSVYNGLKVLGDNIESVVIHDSARPFIDKNIIKKLLFALKDSPAVTLSLRAKEALKEVHGGFVKKSIDRKNVHCIQTPQGFSKKLVLEAHKKNRKKLAYDDSQLVEALGKKVKVIEGSQLNIKITYPQDLKIAKLLLK